MDSDLQTALAFVRQRTEEQANRSGEPLNDEERLLLTNLPTSSELPLWVDPEYSIPIPRDLVYEKLIRMAKDAHREDVDGRPNLLLEWKFAATVLKLKRHPMSWLLQWAKVSEKKPWWDRLLLWMSGLVVVCCGILFAWHDHSAQIPRSVMSWMAISVGSV